MTPTPERAYRAGTLALVVTVIGWHAWVAARQTWFLDDWIYLDRVSTYGFVDYLVQDYNGHVMPLQFAFNRLLTTIAPMSFAAATAVIALMSAGVVVAWSAAFAEAFGPRRRLLLPLALIALTPLSLFSATFWASALQVFPLQVFMGVAVLYAARAARGDDTARPRLLLTYVLALLWWQKSLLLLIPVTAVLVLCGPRRVRPHVHTLAPLAAATAAYLPFYLWARSRTDETLPSWVELPDSVVVRVGDYLSFSAGVVRDLVAPALAGGPWGTIPIAGDLEHRPDAGWTLVLSVGIVAALAVATWLRGRSAWIAWALAGTYLTTAVALIMFSTKYRLLGPFALYEDRYFADVLVVLALAVAMLLSPLRGEPDSARTIALARRLGTRTTRALAGALVVALVASLVTANVLHWQRIGPAPGRDWVRTVAAELEEAGPVSVRDTTPPLDVVPASYWPDELKVSRMFASLHPEASFEAPGQPMMVFDAEGHLRPGEVQPASTSAAGPQPDCGYFLTDGETVDVPMSQELFEYAWGVELTLFSGSGGLLTVTVDGVPQEVTVANGLSSPQLLHLGTVGDVTVRIDGPDASACVTAVRAGELVAQDG